MYNSYVDFYLFCYDIIYSTYISAIHIALMVTLSQQLHYVPALQTTIET